MFEAVAVEPEPTRAELVKDLQARIRRMQRSRLDTHELPAHPALSPLLPGGALMAGSAYAVTGSTTLALGMLQAPSAAGAWCAVVGMPDLGVGAVAGLGIDLERLVLVPQPGRQWLAVVSALIDVVSVVLVRPPASPGEAAASRIAARLRRREAVLVAIGEWPRATAALAIGDSSWTGLGAGFGRLTGRQVTVSSTASRSGRPAARRLWLPGPDQALSPVTQNIGRRSSPSVH
ncbi:MAG: hypothetical protein KF727_12915 [Microbacteriaceae bacterium]|nr:hypothetical protein [Microbacteriaceae bacterium]